MCQLQEKSFDNKTHLANYLNQVACILKLSILIIYPFLAWSTVPLGKINNIASFLQKHIPVTHLFISELAQIKSVFYDEKTQLWKFLVDLLSRKYEANM